MSTTTNENLTLTDSAEVCEPLFFNGPQSSNSALHDLIQSKRPDIVDTISKQVAELITLRRPGYNWTDEEVQLGVRARLGEEPDAYGQWVYYPWRNTLVHLLDEDEYREVRTNRNMHKITADEQRTLAAKRIGIIGMSVGSGVALALAMERCGGTLRIADFDKLELSNLNRIRTSVVNLDLPKVVIVAREIAEIDPYIKVEIYPEGVTDDNIGDFLGTDAPLDLLVEECDSLRIKLLARWKARERSIPVVMETSDRGMLDVERFDLDDKQELLHGRFTNEEAHQLIETGEWTPETVFKVMSPDEVSDRMKLSLQEMGKTISRWPQVGSEVTAGAGMAAQVARMILLGDNEVSGRIFVDADGFYTK